MFPLRVKVAYDGRHGWHLSVLKIASPPLLSYHLSTIAHFHQPASFCVDTFLLCLPLRCGCSSFPALLGLHVDLLCIAALLRHLGEFPFPSGFSLLPLAAICALQHNATPRLKTFRPPGALGDAPVAAAPHPGTFRRKPGSCWDRFCDGRDAAMSAQLSRCSAIHQSISPHHRLSPDKGLNYFAIHVAQLMLMRVIHWVPPTNCRAD